MHKQYVIVEAWVPDRSYGEGHPEHPIVLPPEQPDPPPGVPTHPIYYPPTVWPPIFRPVHPIAPGGPIPPVDPGYGVPGPPYYRPEHPIYYPPGIWGGNDPYPTPPIYFPPGGGGGGGNPPGIWGGSNEGFPTQPGPLPPTGIWPSPGRPAHPIVLPPGQEPPGIWGGSNEGFPTQPGPLPPVGIWPGPGRPEHPIYYPPGIWGGGNEPFPTPPINIGPEVPSYPVFDPSMLPEHPEVPDLNAGNWSRIEDRDGTTKWAFVPWPLAVTHPDYNPRYPPDSAQPGTWVVIVNYTTVPRYGAAWAWIPQVPSGGGTPPDGGTDPNAPQVNPLPA